MLELKHLSKSYHGVKIPVGLSGEGGKEGVLTGGKGQFGIVLSGEGATVQEDFPLKPVQPQNAFSPVPAGPL